MSNEPAQKSADRSASISNDLLCTIDAARRHAMFEMEWAKALSNMAKGQGNAPETTAWNHTYLAYADMLSRLGGA